MTQARLLVMLAGGNSKPCHSVSMAKVTPRFKKPPARHFIRAWRKHRGYTLEQLAEIVGVTHGALSQLERGETNYTQPMLEALSEALSCSPADLIMRDPTDPEGMWSIWDQAAPGERRRIVEVARALLKAGAE